MGAQANRPFAGTGRRTHPADKPGLTNSRREGPVFIVRSILLNTPRRQTLSRRCIRRQPKSGFQENLDVDAWATTVEWSYRGKGSATSLMIATEDTSQALSSPPSEF